MELETKAILYISLSQEFCPTTHATLINRNATAHPSIFANGVMIVTTNATMAKTAKRDKFLRRVERVTAHGRRGSMPTN